MKQRSRLTFIVIFILLCGFSKINGQVFAKLDAAYSNGEITIDQMMLDKIYFIFDRSKLTNTLLKASTGYIKCATPVLLEYNAYKNSLTPATRQIIEDYLPVIGDRNYISAGGHFKITFTTTTTNVHSVPLGDQNANGTPDYVEWVADYLETVWDTEITKCGFKAPIDTQGDGYYNVSFQNMEIGSAGYTVNLDVDGNEVTRIVLHNNFDGFPANQDPAGTQKGAAKVACAHEFKHAIQNMYVEYDDLSTLPDTLNWSELDAAWAEELVFDNVNDMMLNLRRFGDDPFYKPEQSIIPGSYEDYFWHDFLHQKFDLNDYNSAPINLAFWQRRESNSSENILDAYNYVLQQNGSSLSEAFIEYIVWNHYTGSRAVPNFGYDEAAITGFPKAELEYVLDENSLPFQVTTKELENFASNHIRVNYSGTGGLKITFPNIEFPDLKAVVTWTVGNNVYWEVIDSGGVYTTMQKNIGLLIVNPSKNNFFSLPYNLKVEPTSEIINVSFTNKVSGNSVMHQGERYF